MHFSIHLYHPHHHYGVLHPGRRCRGSVLAVAVTAAQELDAVALLERTLATVVVIVAIGALEGRAGGDERWRW